MRVVPALLLVVCAAPFGCDEKHTAPHAAAGEASSAAASALSSAAAASTPAPVATATAPVTVAAQHVLVAYKGAKQAPANVTRSKADARKRADDVVAKAKAGEDFSALVASYSDDPAAKERMGSVGKFTREKMAKPFSDAAFALPVDGVSDVVETVFGYHVIKRNQ